MSENDPQGPQPDPTTDARDGHPKARGARGAGGSEPPGAEANDAKAELFEAIDHFRKAASILFDRAAKDPAVKTATEEAERVIRKLGDTAEPLARQLTDELGKLTSRIAGTVSDAAGGRRKSEAPPPDEE